MSTVTVLRACPKCALEEATATFCGRCGHEIGPPARMFSHRAAVALAGVAVSILLLSGALVVQAALHGPVAAFASVLAFVVTLGFWAWVLWIWRTSPGIRGAHRLFRLLDQFVG
jgi:hypothetical protein